MDSVHKEAECFIKHVTETCNFGKTDRERNELLQTYTGWHESLCTSGDASKQKCVSVSPADLFQCLVSEVTDIHKIIGSHLIMLSQCKNGMESTHFQLDNENICQNQELNLPKLKQRIGVMLLCKIVSVPDRESSASQIFLSDGNDDIPCQIPVSVGKDILMLMDRWVVITSFNLISQSEKGESYIEVCHRPVPVYPVNIKQNLSVVSAEDSKFVLKHKEMLKIDSVNVLTEVATVSEIFRVKSDLIFCIQLTGNISIIVKKKEYLYWQTLIVPQEEYVFTNLKPTTLKKGAGEVLKVYVPWKDSRVLPKCKTDCLLMPLEQLLKSKGIPSSVLQELKQTDIVHEKTDQHNSLCNYQGIITSTQHAKLGFYTLDHKIGLFTCCVPAIYKYNSLRVGTRVVIYNAHMMSSSKEPKLRIMCCLSTCIKVMEFSTVESKVMVFDPMPYFQQIFWKYGVNMTELESIICMYHSLVSKLYPYYTRNVEQILKMILQSVLEKTKLYQRNFLQEFLAEGTHSCCLSRKQDCPIRFDDIPDLKHVICTDDLLQKLDMKAGNRNLNGTSEPTFWKYNVDTTIRGQGQILIGKLQLSSVTGKIQLCDISGQINCIIAELQAEESDHMCTPNCQNINDGSKSKCPWIHPSFIGSIIAVTSFSVVMEKFLSTNNQIGGPTNSINDNQTFTYIQFSMKNVTFLKVPSQQHRVSGINTSQKRKWQEYNSNCTENRPSNGSVNVGKITSHEQIFIVEHVESLLLEGKRNNPQLRFSAVGYILNSEELSCDAGHQLISMILLNKLNENTPVTEASGHSVILEKKVGDVLTSNTEDNTRKPEKYSHLNSKFSNESSQIRKTNASQERTAVGSIPAHTLLFQGNAIQWYHCIFPGGVYKIISLDKAIDFHKTRVTSWHLKRAVTKAGGKSCIVLPENIDCERILAPNQCSKSEDCGFCNSRAPAVVSVKDILTESFSEVLVSFVCHIKTRRHVKSEFMAGKTRQNDMLSKFDVSVLENQAIQLQVQCLSSGEIIQVYMNLENSSYPLGLLPGAEVHFHKMERKISKTGNIYCQYIAVSSVRILKYSLGLELEIQRNAEEIKQQSTVRKPVEKAPYKYLSDLWRSYDVSTVFKCVCHIQKVLKISLKCVCQICGTVVIQNTCGNELCGNNTDIEFLARASLIVEDGTSVAIVTCVGQHLKTVLMLSDDEWACLQESINSNREVFLQQMSVNHTDYSSSERFVVLLCENFNIKRPLVMSLSVQAAVKSKEMKTSGIELDRMILEDFAMKKVDTGILSFETRCLPFLQLECCCIQDLDFSEWTLHNLADVT